MVRPLSIFEVPHHYLGNVVQVAQQHGYDASKLVAQADLKLEELGNWNARISLQKYFHIVRLIVADAGIPGLGLLIGKSENQAGHGVLGHAVLSAHDLRGALKTFIDYQELTGACIYVTLQDQNEIAILNYHEVYPLGAIREFEMDCTLASVLGVFSQLQGGRDPFTEIHVTWPKSDHSEMYLELFNCPVRFDRQRCQLHFSTAHLNLPMQLRNPDVHELCRQQCEMQYSEISWNCRIASRVRNAIIESGDHIPTLLEVADNLHLSSRTLRRHLTNSGTSFRKIIEEIKIAHAQRLLVESDLPISEVGFQIGYLSPHGFHHAFKQHSGMTPNEFRRVYSFG